MHLLLTSLISPCINSATPPTCGLPLLILSHTSSSSFPSLLFLKHISQTSLCGSLHLPGALFLQIAALPSRQCSIFTFSQRPSLITSVQILITPTPLSPSSASVLYNSCYYNMVFSCYFCLSSSFSTRSFIKKKIVPSAFIREPL